MSGAPSHPSGCEEFSTELIEFATGTLAGRDRARVLEHLAACARCRSEVESLARVADAMLELAPTAEPSWGFDQRLIERYRLESPRAPRRRLSIMGQIAAVVILIGAGAGVGTFLDSHRPSTPPPTSAAPLTAELTSHGVVLGHVFLSGSQPAWLYMTFSERGWSQPVWCRVTLRNGDVKSLGSFSLTSGYGAWSARVDATANQIAEAQVTDGSGHVLATARLAS